MKPKVSKIIVYVLLCFAVILPFTACSTNAGNTDNTAATSGGNSEDSGNSAPTAEIDPDKPDLPAVDMNGKTFKVLTAGWGEGSNLAKDIGAEEYTGDPIDDAAYERRVKIEQEYNCKIVQVNEPINEEAVKKYQTSILAADGAYDFALTNCTNFSSLLTGNYLIDFKDVPYIDMNKPYWDKNFYESMAILGRHFAANGDISKRRLECVWIMCFNKKMMVDNQLESPYELVKSGQWTFDKMTEMGRKAARDLDGDGKMTKDDLWGVNYTGDTIMGIVNSSGVRIAELDANGIPQLTINTESNLEKLMRIYTEMRDDVYSIDTLFRFWLGDTDIFADNRCLLLAAATHNINTLRTIDVDFGIIPYPKWDLAQETYTPCTAGNFYSVLSVPKSNGDLENTGIILEAYSYEGRKTVSPAFYESLLKTKTARDEESVEMIDYIFGNISYDIGNMYNFGDIVGTFGYGMSATDNRKVNIVSTVEKNSGKWQSAIDKMVDEISKGE